MRTILVGLFLICSLNGSTQDTAITYSQIKAIEGMSKNDIYNKTKLWATSIFEHIRGAMQVDDREAGLMAFDANQNLISPNAPHLKDSSTRELMKLLPYYYKYSFRFKVQMKNGKYKIDVTDVKFIGDAGTFNLTSSVQAPYKVLFQKQSKTNEEWSDVKTTFDKSINDLFNSLYQAVIKQDDF